MKKPWLLILAAIILVTLIGIWLYLFFGGDEAREDLYNTFGLTGDELPFDLDEVFEDQATTTSPYLRQLSLRQTAGYVALDASSTSPRTARLVEAGTGHIYSVKVEDGSEERLSNITVPSAESAIFSKNGAYTAVTVGGGSVTIITLPNGSTTLSSTVLNINPISISFTTSDTLLYAVKEGQSVRGYEYNLITTDTKSLFTVPFREAVILWGETAAGPHYTYPKTAEELEGYLYKIESGTIVRQPISGFGLSVKTRGDTLVYSKTENGALMGYAIQNGEVVATKYSFIPEKCAVHGEIFVCGIDSENRALTEWYRGEYISNDSLWYFIPGINYTTKIVDLEAIAQRLIDITYPSITNTALFFVNRADSGLWVYDRDFEPSVLDN